MSSSIPFQPLSSDPTNHEPITTRPRRKLSLADYLELAMDRLSEGMGPVLIVMAVILLSITIYCFFAVFIPIHYPQAQEGEGGTRSAGYMANMMWSCYLVWGILANYFYAVITPPGSTIDGVSSGNVKTTTKQMHGRLRIPNLSFAG